MTKVELIPTCEECRTVWLPDDCERWRASFVDDGDEDRLVFYCADCWEREGRWIR